MKIIFSDEADADLLRILGYVAERNPAAARGIAKVINEKIKRLGAFPFLGRDRSVFARGLRSIVAESYVIFYRVEENCVFIARIFDGRRDIDAEFE